MAEVDQKRVDAIKKALTNINKKHGEGSVSFFGDVGRSLEVERMSTGLVSLDFILGGGLPKGTFVELAGPPSVGKTTLSIGIMSQVIRRGGLVFFLDVENAFDPYWAYVHGIHPDAIDNQFIISQETVLETGLAVTEAVLKTGVDLVVIDSLAAMIPKVMLEEKEMGDDEVGTRAKRLGQFAARTQRLVRESGTIVLFTNQWRDSIGYKAADSPGGYPIKHAFGVRLRVKGKTPADSGRIKDSSGRLIGQISTIETIKNKFHPPYKECDFRIDFDGVSMGINYNFDLVEQAIMLGILTKSGSWYTYKDEIKLQGTNQWVERLCEDEELRAQIDNEVRAGLGMTDERIL